MAELALKSTLVLAIGGLVAWWMGRISASHRHGAWLATFAALLVLPCLVVLGPAWEVDLLPASRAAVGDGPHATLRADGIPLGDVAGGGLAVEQASVEPSASNQPVWAYGLWVNGLSGNGPWVKWPSGKWPLVKWIVGLWLFGVLIVGVRQFWGLILAYRVVRAAQPAGTESARLAARVACASGLPAPVELLRSETMRVPFVWGLGRHAVVLPAQANDWDTARLETVLLHEMAHLRRRDAWTQLVMQVVVACYWPHPLVWRAYRACMDAREAACDDAVLRSGASAPDYAAHLVAVARELRASRLALQAAVPMFGGDELGTRVRSILDGARRRDAVKPWVLMVSFGVAGALGTGLATVEPAAVSPETRADQSVLPVTRAEPSVKASSSVSEPENTLDLPAAQARSERASTGHEVPEEAVRDQRAEPSGPPSSTGKTTPEPASRQEGFVLKPDPSPLTVKIILADTVSVHSTRLTSGQVARLLDLSDPHAGWSAPVYRTPSLAFAGSSP
ncbi:MAG: M56 family metallopeptidase [Bacteroidota bacterium]